MTTRSEITELLSRYFYCRGKITITPAGMVDVSGSVEFMGRVKFTQLPVKFRYVGGYFVCRGQGLTTLEGCPTHVGDNFDCSKNNLTSLEHAPIAVGKNFLCDENELTSLEHAPQMIDGKFNCSHNQLKNLLHAPTHVGIDFSCHGNPLVSLEGAPPKVGRYWWLTYTPYLPLLRTLNCEQVEFVNMTKDANKVALILNQHSNTGRPGIIRASVALIRAGYKENARW